MSANELERQLASLQPGSHLCPIYETLAEQMAAAVPFLKEGLAKRERCLYIADDRTAEQVTQALAASDVDVARVSQQGALQLLTKRESYLPAAEFEPQQMLDFISRSQTQALADGFAGLRLAGEMTWALHPEVDGDRVIEYEALLNGFLANSRSTLLCQYNRDRFSPAVIHDVLLTHPIVILGGLVCPNPFYEPAELLVDRKRGGNSPTMTRRVEWRIGQLKEARTATRERERLLERLQALSRRLLEVQELERRHLARELHDEIGQMLTGLTLLLKVNDSLPMEELLRRFEQARAIVDELFKKVRRLSFDLRPAALDQFGLAPALADLFERYTQQTGIRVNFAHSGVEGRFPTEVETTAYRIVQEALTNIARHANVTEAAVRLSLEGGNLLIQVEDPGTGFDPEATLAAGRSSGLLGMQERVGLLGGRLIIESSPGGGTHLLAELPLAIAGGGEEQ